MSFNSSANVYVVNNTGGNAIIILSHEYSDDGPQLSNWPNPVSPGDPTPSPLSIGFNTGTFYTGQDYWCIVVQVLDGPNAGTYSSEGSLDAPTKECLCESGDNGQNLYFSVDDDTFSINLTSGTCSTSMNKLSSAQIKGAKVAKDKIPA